MTLWGGRFQESMSDVTRRFTGDESDRRLLRFDLEGSIAHAGMLGETGIITDAETARLIDGLQRILDEADEFGFVDTDEDVHTAVERRLGELVGEVAGKLHTGRSRNDQVALDLRLYLRDAGRARIAQIEETVQKLADVAESHAETIVPSYTHLQQAQATTLGHHFLAHAWSLLRDGDRFADCVGRLDVSPLGAGASAGSTLPLDRELVAATLGMKRAMANSLDAVATRDFVAEYVFCCAQAMVGLSRLSEEVVLWVSSEFGWAQLSDQVSTGSSALPQKRNPDIAELVRGRAATVAGDMTAILSLQKALPLTYNRDLQEDKRIVFHADDTVGDSLEAITTLLGGLELAPPAPGPETTALDLAEALVRRGVPFREAHEAVGRLLKRVESDGQALAAATAADLTEAHPVFEPGDLALLDPVESVGRRLTSGSGNPESVKEQLAALRDRLGG